MENAIILFSVIAVAVAVLASGCVQQGVQFSMPSRADIEALGYTGIVKAEDIGDQGPWGLSDLFVVYEGYRVFYLSEDQTKLIFISVMVLDSEKYAESLSDAFTTQSLNDTEIGFIKVDGPPVGDEFIYLETNETESGDAVLSVFFRKGGTGSYIILAADGASIDRLSEIARLVEKRISDFYSRSSAD